MDIFNIVSKIKTKYTSLDRVMKLFRGKAFTPEEVVEYVEMKKSMLNK